MARPLRLEVPDGSYHVWNRGVNRADIVFDDHDREYFLILLRHVVRRFGWIVHQFVLMTNDLNLILSTLDPTLSRGMKWLEQKFAQHINRRYDRSGPLYQGRFKAQLVQRGSHRESRTRPFPSPSWWDCTCAGTRLLRSLCT